ncbi:MAG: M20/M25/M40 family metallo-hydrolase [Bacteroidetes bacterium]|nr:M20/M25/M40 family metallo-hydrolase [Bacteroidota bacterium]
MKTILVLVLAAASLHGQSFDPAARAGYESIKATDLKKHVLILASDSLEGRETAEPGQRKAAAYIASHFGRLGLKPVGSHGGYLQPFEVEVTKVDPSRSSLVVNADEAWKQPWGEEYLTMSMKDTTVTSSIVFVGYVDTRIAPETRPKVAGRIVVSLLGTRQQATDTSANAPMMRMFASRRDSGVAVVLSIADDTGRTSFSAVYEMLSGIGMDKGQMRLKDAAPGNPRMVQQQVRGLLSAGVADRLLRAAGASLSELRSRAAREENFQPVFLDKIAVTVRNAVIRETRPTENVVGLLEGSDPVLKNEIVVFTGHYDHIGTTRSGVIYYGADDDASGTAAVMEVAEAFVANPVKPKRSLLFMAVTGEEKGLLGSTYYVNHPLFPLEKTVANLNSDMLGRMDTKYEPKNEPNYVYVIGSDKISPELDSLMKAANEQTVGIYLDYTYNDENDPNQFYRRSDHYNFAKNGIPVVFFFTGTHADYHQPTDTPDKLLYDRMSSITRLIYATGWSVAQKQGGLNRKSASGS